MGSRRALIYAVIFIAAFGTNLLRIVRARTLADPPETGDGHDYDALAYNIWQGRGYGFYWDDPGFRAPYENLPRYDLLRERHSRFYSTTYRPPGVPVVLAGVYTVTNRSFAAWRILNCVLVAGAVTLAAAAALEAAGPWGGILTATLGTYSPRLAQYAGLFMTEGLAAFLLTLTGWLWIRSATDGWTTRRAVAAGLSLGALMATRSIFVLWLPLVLLLPGGDTAVPGRSPWRLKLCCLGVALCVIGPWWVRNIAVTRAFMPLGSEGALNARAGFGPLALTNEGLWASNFEDGANRPFAQNTASTEWEVELGQHRMRLAVGWIRMHFRDVMKLMHLHVWQEVRPRGHLFTDVLMLAAVASLVVLRRWPGAAVIALMAAANLGSIALTWSVGGRFLLPIQPLLLAAIGAGLATAAAQASSFRRAAAN